MILKSLSVQGLRGITSLEIPNLGGLNVLVGPLEESARVSDTIFYQSSVGPVVVICVEDHAFIDICFHTRNSPWATSVDFGRQAACELRCVVRCEPGHYYPEVDPLSDVWLEINGDQEQLTT